MTVFLLLFTAILFFFTGFVLIYFLWPLKKPFIPGVFIILSISFGSGAAINSILLFVWLILFNSVRGFFYFEIFFSIFLIILFIYLIKNKPFSFAGEKDRVEAIDISKIICYIAFFILLISSFILFISFSLRMPSGSWDAWGIWNLKARFIFRNAENWKAIFTELIDWSHPDYPLFIPLNIVQGWININGETFLVPSGIAFLFTFLTVILLTFSLMVFRGKIYGLAGGIILLGTPFFISHGSSQYADIPLAFFFLSTLVLVTFYEVEKNNNLLILTGMTGCLSLWVKNEGLLFLTAFLIAFFYVTFRKESRQDLKERFFMLLKGIIPVLVIIICFKMFFAPSGDLFAGQGLKIIFSKLLDISRYKIVLYSYYINGVTFTGGKAGIPLLIICLLLAGIKREEKYLNSINSVIITLVIMFLGYFFIFITTPRPLQWHLDTSLNRLFLQLWPCIIFYFFMITAIGENISLHNGRSRVYSFFIFYAKRLALLIIIISAFISNMAELRAEINTFGTYAISSEYYVSLFENKFGPLRGILPHNCCATFISDKNDRMEVVNYYAIQYSLAPMVLVNKTDLSPYVKKKNISDFPITVYDFHNISPSFLVKIDLDDFEGDLTNLTSSSSSPGTLSFHITKTYEKDNIIYIDLMVKSERNIISGSKIYILLKSDKRIYIFSGNASEGKKRNFTCASFVINKELLDGGTYLAGFYIKAEDLEQVQYTDKKVDLF